MIVPKSYYDAEAKWTKERDRLRSFIYRNKKNIDELKLILMMAENELQDHMDKRPNIADYAKDGPPLKSKKPVNIPTFRQAKRKLLAKAMQGNKKHARR